MRRECTLLVLDQSKKRSLTKLEGKRTNLGQILAQAKFIKTSSLVRTEKRGRTGTEEFPDSQGQSTNDHLGDTGRVVACLARLPLAGLVEIDTY